MNILIIGGGGREHALCWKLAQSPAVEKIFCAPGNAGTARIARNVALALEPPFAAAIEFAKQNRIGLTVVGPEAPLVAGIVGAFESAGLKIFGPSQIAAQLEGSKAFAKEIMAAAGVPTAKAETFDSLAAAENYLRQCEFPIVIKADGLAAGKGVSIHDDCASAQARLAEIFEQKIFGAAGAKILIEEFLTGPEASVFAVCDGENFVTLLPAQDHKPIGEGDTGPNTGGMGAYTPAPAVDAPLLREIERTVIAPVLAEMNRRGAPFRGCLFAGMMLTPDGPSVLEFNCRFGDPETQPLMRLLDTDLLELLLAATEGRLQHFRCAWKPGFALGVVMAAGGYPGAYETGKTIGGLEDADALDGVVVFHAGTAQREDRMVTSGGRVLCVTGCGDTAEQAAEAAYAGVNKVHFNGAYFRRDIGYRILGQRV